MDSMLREVPGVCVYLDDILISGANDKEHLLVERLNSVLKVLSSRGLRLSKEKCSFSQPSVHYRLLRKNCVFHWGGGGGKSRASI